MAFAAAFTKLSPHLGWLMRHQRGVQVAGGVLMLTVGLSMVTGIWDVIVGQLRNRSASFGTIL